MDSRRCGLQRHRPGTRYNQYKEASRQNLANFIQKYPPVHLDEAMSERMLDAVRWVGNPYYEHGPDAVNNHPDPVERERRNFINRILTLARDVDLPRCYGPGQFNSTMKEECLALSVPGDDQKSDFRD